MKNVGKLIGFSYFVHLEKKEMNHMKPLFVLLLLGVFGFISKKGWDLSHPQEFEVPNRYLPFQFRYL